MREPDAIKLFVGQVPRDWSEKDLQAIFEPFGDIHSLNLLQDKATGQHKGCAFLTYYENESAKAAQEELHERKTLPGARNPIQVKPATSETNADTRKLFLGMLSRSLDEKDLTTMFSQFGTIEDVTILKTPDGKSKGCAFIKFGTRLQAQNAIKTMHNSETMEGCRSPLVVKIADTEKDKLNKKRYQGGVPNIPGLGMPIGQTGAASASGGMGPLQQNPYYQQLLAQMALPQLVAANPGLIGAQAVPGTMGALVAAMATQQQQLQQQQQQPVSQSQAGISTVQATGARPGAPNLPMLGYNTTGTSGDSTMQQAYSGIQQYIAASLPQPYSTTSGVQQQQLNNNKKEGPEGANLFIYQVPSEFNDADLMQIFMPFGNVISAKVFIDKTTGLSKGFGFVSYDNATNASSAIQAMNGFAIGAKRLKVQLKHPKVQAKPY